MINSYLQKYAQFIIRKVGLYLKRFPASQDLKYPMLYPLICVRQLTLQYFKSVSYTHLDVYKRQVTIS